jgi:hypothetical protein
MPKLLKDFLVLLVAAATAVLLYLLSVPAGWVTALVVGLALVLVLYIVGAVLSDGLWRELVRGGLVGFNAGLNAVLLVAIWEGLFVVALILAGLNVLAAFRPASTFKPYQFLLGALNFVLPMSWPAIALGIALALFNLLGGLLGKWVPYFKLLDASFSWVPICVSIKGGFVSNLNYAKTAFNMSIVTFTAAASASSHERHEAGHCLNVAAFGTLFHLIGAIDENILRRGQNAFAELIANSNAASPPNIPMWS